MKLEELQNKKILILGYGKEGHATEAFLKEKFPSIQIGIADKSEGSDYLQKQKDFDLVIKTPGIPKSQVTIPYTTATNIFFANINAITIGVTGSKGKSTTASLIAHILKTAGKTVHLVGNIGTPMIGELTKPYSPEDIFVCELSSYQTDDLLYSPHISVITSLFPEHMNYHGSIEAYYEAKHQLIRHVRPNDYYIYNPKYQRLQEWAMKAPCKTIPYHNYSIQKCSLIGKHNLENMNGAATVATLFNVSEHTIQESVSTFQPLPHRMELVGTFKNILFYDDAISTAPESTIAAIESLGTIDTLILGGEDRGFDFRHLIEVISDHAIPNIVLFPKSGATIKTLIQKTGYRPNILDTTSMEEAVRFAFSHSVPGSICLLSTASPSYSIWKNFEEKGNEFQKFVKALGN